MALGLPTSGFWCFQVFTDVGGEEERGGEGSLNIGWRERLRPGEDSWERGLSARRSARNPQHVPSSGRGDEFLYQHNDPSKLVFELEFMCGATSL